jgi:hypothetical protein
MSDSITDFPYETRLNILYQPQEMIDEKALSDACEYKWFNQGQGARILLVLPFDNRSGQPSLEWIREAAPEILTSRFAAAGGGVCAHEPR